MKGKNNHRGRREGTENHREELEHRRNIKQLIMDNYNEEGTVIYDR